MCITDSLCYALETNKHLNQLCSNKNLCLKIANKVIRHNLSQFLFQHIEAPQYSYLENSMDEVLGSFNGPELGGLELMIRK